MIVGQLINYFLSKRKKHMIILVGKKNECLMIEFRLGKQE